MTLAAITLLLFPCLVHTLAASHLLVSSTEVPKSQTCLFWRRTVNTRS